MNRRSSFGAASSRRAQPRTRDKNRATSGLILAAGAADRHEAKSRTKPSRPLIPAPGTVPTSDRLGSGTGNARRTVAGSGTGKRPEGTSRQPICLPISATMLPRPRARSAELGARDLLRAVAERLLGSRMRLDDDPVRARRPRQRARQRQARAHAVPAACDGSTITGRCVSCFSTGDGADDRACSASARLERRDPALAQDHPLGSLLDARTRPPSAAPRPTPTGRASTSTGLSGPADLGRSGKFCMLRAPIWITSASSRTASTWRGSISSVTIGSPVSSRASREDRQRLVAEPLERARRRPRLERAAAQHRPAGVRRPHGAVSSVCSRYSTVHGPAIRPNAVVADLAPRRPRSPSDPATTSA